MRDSDERIIETFISQLNGYLGRPETHYDHTTGKFGVGSFYLDKTIDRKGKRAYRICEVLAEDGTHKAYAEYGLKTEEVKVWIDGLTTGINIERRLAGEEPHWVRKGV